MIYSIENDYIKLSVDTYGGKFDSVFDKVDRTELLWQGSADSWTGKDITVFPFVGRLMDGFYLHKGNRYSMRIHGLADYRTFELQCIEKDSISLILKSDSDTLSDYPFEFELLVKYTLFRKKITKSFTVNNLSKKEMPFGLGGHPGFNITGNGKDAIVFRKPQKIKRLIPDESHVFMQGMHEEYVSVIKLNKSVFANDAIIFENVIGDIILENGNGRKISFELNSPPVLAFWTHKEKGDYVAVEPWWGLPDYNPPVREISKKAKINILKPNESFNYSFSFTIINA